MCESIIYNLRKLSRYYIFIYTISMIFSPAEIVNRKVSEKLGITTITSKYLKNILSVPPPVSPNKTKT